MNLKLVIDSEVFIQVKDVYSKRQRAHDRMLRCLVVHMKMPDARRKVVGALSCRIVKRTTPQSLAETLDMGLTIPSTCSGISASKKVVT